MTLNWTAAAIGRCRYGSTALWGLSGDLVGGFARRFAQQVSLFFRSESAPLLADLRRVGLIDSAGAAALSRCAADHPDFVTIGRPPAWRELPLAVRRSLGALRSEPDIETVLAAEHPVQAGYPHQRRYPRLPLQIPVEVLCAGRSAQGALRDISRGGVRLAHLPEGWLGELRRSGNATVLGILGLEADPLCRELTSGFPVGPVPVVPVCALPGGILGARFSASHPPV